MAGFRFVPMSNEHLAVMDGWTYGEFFPDFDVDAYHESAQRGSDRLSGPAGCDGYAAFDSDEDPIGIFEYYFSDDGTASIGLALRPELTNRGLGRGFLEAGIEFLRTNYDYDRAYVHLSVDPHNDPALKLYVRAGFELVSPDLIDGELHMQRQMSICRPDRS